MSSASLPSRPRAARPAWTRAVDVVVAGLGLVLAAPLLLVLAVAIRLGSSGPVFERQVVRDRRGRRIELLSLRTMVDGGASRSHARLVEVTAAGSPVTPVGRVLRRTRLELLPRLVNVLRGEVSLFRPQA